MQLIVVPTRELAVQALSFDTYAKYTNLTQLTILVGSQNPQ
jgi:ATP-dependent RNA helicase RhlE